MKMSIDTIGAVLFILALIIFLVVMAQWSAKEYSTQHSCNDFYFQDEWDNRKVEITRAEFEKRKKGNRDEQ